MRIPFFNSKPKKTRLGLTEGAPISDNSFKIVEEKFKQYYGDLVEKNTKVLNSKLEKAKIWSEFVRNSANGIPKDYMSEIKTVIDPKMDLESVAHPRVYLQITYIRANGSSSIMYDVYSTEHDDSERSINKILEDIRNFKKELAIKDVK